MCLNTGTPKKINFSFQTNGKLMALGVPILKHFLQGTVKGKRKRGRQKKRWENNIKEWTGMDFASSTRAAGNRSRWKGIDANSSVVPRRPSKVMG